MRKLTLLFPLLLMFGCSPTKDSSWTYHVGDNCVFVSETHNDPDPSNDFENALYCKVDVK